MNVPAALVAAIAMFALFVWTVFTYDRHPADIRIYDKTVIKTPPPCLRLDATDIDRSLKKRLSRRYTFRDDCPYMLKIDFKSRIACNSPYNASQKACGMPTSYLRIEIRKGMRLVYSYYVDLDEAPDSDTIEEAFEEIVQSLHI